jgi:amino acid transporter
MTIEKSDPTDTAAAPADESSGEGGLAAGVITAREALFQAVSHLGPAAGIIILAPVIAGLVGASSPLLLIAAMVAVLLTGLCVVALARKLPSAGGYYAYVSNSLGGRAGFVTSWSYFLYDPPQPAFILLATGGILQPVIAQQLAIDIPWWLLTLVLLAIVTALTLFGAKLSARATVLLGVFETIVIVAYAAAVLIHTGHLSAEPLAVPHVDSQQTLFLAFAFSVLLFTGFESAAPLAEETVQPRKVIPRVVIWSILLVGAVWVFVDYALVLGWGVDDATGIAAESSPFFTLAGAVAPWLWILVAFALLNSALAISLAGVNAGSRVMFSLGRAGLFPAAFGRTHPKWRTPWTAILSTAGFNAVLAIGVGAWLGPVPGAAFVGLIITLGVIVVYILGNVSVPVLYWKRYHAEWNVLHHAIIPAVATAILLLGLYFSLWPIPAYPNNIVLYFVAAWLVLGVAISATLWRTHRAAFEAAGTVMFTGDSPADEGQDD